MSTTANPQTSLYETTIDNPDLEAALEARQELKDEAAEARKALKEATDKVKVRIDDLDLGDAPVRVGRFVIARTPVAAGVVSFETDPTTRLQIKLLSDE